MGQAVARGYWSRRSDGKRKFMKKLGKLGTVLALALLVAPGYAQKTKPPKAKPAAAASAPKKDVPAALKTDSAELETTLSSMDRAAESFKSTEADFNWDQYTRAVEETDNQKGKIYFRRNGKEIQMAAEIAAPEAKVVVYSDGQVKMYQP